MRNFRRFFHSDSNGVIAAFPGVCIGCVDFMSVARHFAVRQNHTSFATFGFAWDFIDALNKYVALSELIGIFVFHVCFFRISRPVFGSEICWCAPTPSAEWSVAEEFYIAPGSRVPKCVVERRNKLFRNRAAPVVLPNILDHDKARSMARRSLFFFSG